MITKCVFCKQGLPLAIMCHNAEPVSKGFCCIYCNYTIVVPERLRMIENA